MIPNIARYSADNVDLKKSFKKTIRDFEKD
jgi:hypothetical protein